MDSITSVFRSTNRKNDIILFVIICIIILAIAIVDMVVHNDWEDLSNYLYDANMFVEGNMPYRDYMFEYPPMALVFMLVPRIFSGDIVGYSVASSIFAGLCFFVCAYFLLKMADNFKISHRWVLVLLVLTLLFASTFVTRRNDIIAAMLVIIGLWLYFKSNYAWAFVIIALAGLLKMYPLLLIIPMILPFIIKRDKILEGSKYLGVAILTCLVIQLPFLISDPSTAFDYLSYHSDRGVQIESVVGGFIMLGNYLFPGDLFVIHNYGSHNLAGSIPDAIAPYMNLFLFLAIMIFMIWLLWRLYVNSNNETCMRLLLIFSIEGILMIFIAFSKVYSAQYMIWIMTIFPLLLLPEIGNTYKLCLMVMFILLGIFSMINGSYTYPALCNMQLDGILVTVFKNIMHMVLMIYILWVMYRVSTEQININASKGSVCN